MNKTIFLDRDGTIIEDHGYLDNAEAIELLPGVGDSLVELVKYGFQLILITNQSGIGRGKFGHDVVQAQNEKLQQLLKPYGIRFISMKYCPHHPDDECNCRKPEPGMILEAAEEENVDLGRSWMLGDKVSDVQAGKKAGCRTILFNELLTEEADYHAESMEDAVRIIKILDR